MGRLLEEHGIGDFIGLARLIAGGDVFGFEWRNELCIPMFRFELCDLSVKPAAQRVRNELAPTAHGYEVVDPPTEKKLGALARKHIVKYDQIVGIRVPT